MDIEDIIIYTDCDAGVLPYDRLEHYFVHILCLKGSGVFHVNGNFYPLKVNDIAIWLPDTEVTDMCFSADFKANFFLMSYDIATRNNPDTSWGVKGYLFTKETPVVALTKQQKRKCTENWQTIHSVKEDVEHHFQKEILNLKIQIFIMDMWDIFAGKIEEQLSSQEQRASVFGKFLNLVDVHCMEHRNIGFYSEKLCITPKYLSEICKKNSGKSASEWIQNYMTQRIILLLRNHNLTLTEIAETLHFSSQSFFSRYVRKVLGMSPSEYRHIRER